jgi:hypothetical protein
VRKISILFIIFYSCTSPYFPKGKPEELVIFSENLFKIKEFIEKEIQDTFYTPRPEPIYDIIFAKNEEFDKYKGYYTILILATPYSKSYKVFKEIFPEVKKEGIYEKNKVFQKEDYIVGLLFYSEDILLKEIKKGILNKIIEHIRNLYKKHVYSIVDINRGIKREIKKEYGFEIDIPTGFLYIKKSKDFVSLGTHYPDRFIFFYIKEKMELVPEKLMDLRDSLTDVYYDGDKIDRSLTKWKRTKIFGEDAIEIYGHWENEKMKIGGAFKSFAFKKDNKYYFIDMGVFEPEKPKLKYIRWLEAIVLTMRWNS